jgi:hypothetical protein
VSESVWLLVQYNMLHMMDSADNMSDIVALRRVLLHMTVQMYIGYLMYKVIHSQQVLLVLEHLVSEVYNMMLD